MMRGSSAAGEPARSTDLIDPAHLVTVYYSEPARPRNRSVGPSWWYRLGHVPGELQNGARSHNSMRL
jgi:hypothetical protein